MEAVFAMAISFFIKCLVSGSGHRNDDAMELVFLQASSLVTPTNKLMLI